jgi:hypothetical protein
MNRTILKMLAAAGVAMVWACGSSSESGEAAKVPDDAGTGTAAADGAASADAMTDSASAPSGSACKVDDDCRLQESTCGGCSCLVLGKSEEAPACTREMVSCFAPSCTGLVALCIDKQCKRAKRCEGDGDCRLVNDYCGGNCNCRSLPKDTPDPSCPGSQVSCESAPCAGKQPSCDQGRCTSK